MPRLPLVLFRRLALLLLPTAALAGHAGAQDPASAPPGPGSVLLKNVAMLDPQGGTEDVVVNIVLRDGKLDLVTQDRVPSDSVELTLDAKQGLLLGNLVVGEPPTFMIMDGDFREDFDILLDTAAHARFAIREGVVVRNLFLSVVGTPVDEEPKKAGWLAYMPPPMAVPSNYLDTSKWNRWDTRFVSGIFLGAVVLDRQNWQTQDTASESQVGDLNAFDGGEIRGLRFGAVGTLNFPQPWAYTVFGTTNAFEKGFDTRDTDDIQLFDLRVDIPTYGGTTISLGKQKEPISMERIMGMIYLPLQERSAVSDALLPARNIGAVISGTAFGQRTTWAAGIFNDWLDGGGSIENNATQVVGRLTWIPLVSADESNLLHLGFGLRHSDTKEGIQVATEPEFNQSPDFVDTGRFAADSALTYDFETSWRRGPVWLAGEYVLADTDAPTVGDPRLSGYHLTASWAISGEMRGYNKKSGIFNPLPIARTVDQHGWGAWETAVRWSRFDATDAGLNGGDMSILSLGLGWWLKPTVQVSVNYRWIVLDRFGVEGESSGFLTRVVITLE